jgi:hypothetical protein
MFQKVCQFSTRNLSLFQNTCIVVSFLLDSTIGLFVIYLGLKFTQVIVNKCNCETLKFGEYGKKYYIWYIHECLLFVWYSSNSRNKKKMHCFYRYNEIWSLAVISFFIITWFKFIKISYIYRYNFKTLLKLN